MDKVRVLKFGGTSLADPDSVKRAASIVLERKRAGCKVVVVVSARATQTDSLIEDARTFCESPSPREMDMLLTSGERISSALLSIALNSMGAKAVSLTGSQAGIITDDNHTNARIIEIRPYRVAKALGEGAIVVVGGFQGVSFKKEITTLGRGGSDVTAVALASALDAELCEIFSDVDGVYSADPRLVDRPRKLDEISYQEMQELAEAGAKVLHPKSIEFAKIKNTLVHAKSSMEPQAAGTIISSSDRRIKPRVIGVASEEKVALVCAASSAGSRILEDLIEFCRRRELKAKQVSFTSDGQDGLAGSLVLPEKENYHIDSALLEMSSEFPATVQIQRHWGTVSLIGAGITERHDTLLATLRLLKERGVPLGALHTSSFRISCIVPRSQLEETVRALHRHFIESFQQDKDESDPQE